MIDAHEDSTAGTDNNQNHVGPRRQEGFVTSTDLGNPITAVMDGEII